MDFVWMITLKHSSTNSKVEPLNILFKLNLISAPVWRHVLTLPSDLSGTNWLSLIDFRPILSLLANANWKNNYTLGNSQNVWNNITWGYFCYRVNASQKRVLFVCSFHLRVTLHAVSRRLARAIPACSWGIAKLSSGFITLKTEFFKYGEKT